MKRRTTGNGRNSYLLLLAFLAMGTIPAPESCAKGPVPKPDFVIEASYDAFVSTGTIETSGDFWVEDFIWDWYGEWLVCRLSDDPTGYYYFETILPGEGGDRRNVSFQLTAGPNGYLHNGVLYQGVFASGIAKGRDTWQWVLDDDGNRLFKRNYQEWTLNCFLNP